MTFCDWLMLATGVVGAAFVAYGVLSAIADRRRRVAHSFPCARRREAHFVWSDEEESEFERARRER